MTDESVVEIVPTCVPKDAAALAACARSIKPFADEIHVDLTDGLFAPALTWPYVKKGEFGPFDLSAVEKLAVEVHLMVEEPRRLGVQVARAGALRIIAHIEAFQDLDEAHGALDAWRENGAREVGLGLLMQTPFELIEDAVPALDVVHLMSIQTIGTQGIPYDPGAPERIAEFHERFPDTLISVDGGVGESNIADLVQAGARRFGVGSAISRAPDPALAYRTLLQLAQNALP